VRIVAGLREEGSAHASVATATAAPDGAFAMHLPEAGAIAGAVVVEAREPAGAVLARRDLDPALWQAMGELALRADEGPRDGVVAVGTGSDAIAALDRALEPASFDQRMALALTGGPVAAALAPAGDADPAVVDALVRRLGAQGFSDVGVVSHGDEIVTHDFGGVVGVRPTYRLWRESALRVVVASIRPDRGLFYRAAMAGALAALPEGGDRPRAALSDVVRTVLEALPVAFAVAHTPDGGSVLAGADPFAVDWVAGEKMDLDPALNPVVREGLLRWGRLTLDRRGNLTPWEGWRSPRPLSVALAGAGKEAAWTAR
jgi:hypothetical protein